MLLKVIDGAGALQTVVSAGQEAVVDRSGAIAQDAVAQAVMPANPLRSGWWFQNVSARDMWINELADATEDGKSFLIPMGAIWPPAGYPVSTGKLSVIGLAGDSFLAREW